MTLNRVQCPKNFEEFEMKEIEHKGDVRGKVESEKLKDV